ncbi:MAG TPA: arsenate reductase ArsC [Gemmatimonadales bacterium]|nr:arsenate reductase ArsC [Gemmatimonadales bacterium]
MTTAPQAKLRVLFLCTGNSARSQMAEAILNAKGKGRFHAESAGSQPAARVNPLTIETMQSFRSGWTGRPPRGLEGLDRQHWDFVITVCDKAREACPIFPGQPVIAHWGMVDPAAATGDAEAQRAAFRDAFYLLNRRIELLVSLPIGALERLALEARVRAIGATEPSPSPHRM